MRSADLYQRGGGMRRGRRALVVAPGVSGLGIILGALSAVLAFGPDHGRGGGGGGFTTLLELAPVNVNVNANAKSAVSDSAASASISPSNTSVVGGTLRAGAMSGFISPSPEASESMTRPRANDDDHPYDEWLGAGALSASEIDLAPSLSSELFDDAAMRESASSASADSDEAATTTTTTIRYYDGRPIRPARVVRMKTTAYSPDARSCAPFADGVTASGYSVWTNGGRMIAADKSVPFGTLISVPGYNGGRPTPVLDRGGKIKGNRLDVLYPTHEEALEWGVKDQIVTIWEYVEEEGT